MFSYSADKFYLPVTYIPRRTSYRYNSMGAQILELKKGNIVSFILTCSTTGYDSSL